MTGNEEGAARALTAIPVQPVAASVAARAEGKRPPAADLLRTPGALLTRSDLRDLGLERRAIDAVLRELDVVVLPGYSRPMVKADDYLALLEASRHNGSRVR